MRRVQALWLLCHTTQVGVGGVKSLSLSVLSIRQAVVSLVRCPSTGGRPKFGKGCEFGPSTRPPRMAPFQEVARALCIAREVCSAGKSGS